MLNITLHCCDVLYVIYIFIKYSQKFFSWSCSTGVEVAMSGLVSKHLLFKTKQCHGLHTESSLRAKIKIICSEFILSSFITAPPMAWSGGDMAWREAVEEPHLPSLPAKPQECFSSGPLSLMWRRPLHRVCFACKAGCRCCPRKAAMEGDQDTRRPHCHATRLAWPRFAATPL